MKTPSIIELLVAASDRAAMEGLNAEPQATSRFPVVVSQDTRVFLEAQAAAMGGSLAGLCGAILNEVVVVSKQRASELQIQRQTPG